MHRIFSGHSEMRLETNNRKKLGEFTNMWKLVDTVITDKPNKKPQGGLENT